MAISSLFGKLGAEKIAASVVLAGVIVSALPVCAATVVYDDDAVVADNLVLEGEYQIDVAAEKTVTLNGVLSGTGWLHKVGELYVDGQRQADGTYGSPESSAEHKSDLFEGPGILKVGDLGVILLVR